MLHVVISWHSTLADHIKTALLKMVRVFRLSILIVDLCLFDFMHNSEGRSTFYSRDLPGQLDGKRTWNMFWQYYRERFRHFTVLSKLFFFQPFFFFKMTALGSWFLNRLPKGAVLAGSLFSFFFLNVSTWFKKCSAWPES